MLKIDLLCPNVYLVKEDNKKTNRINSLMVEDKDKSVNILIDANFSFENIDELYSLTESKIRAIIFSHFHTDHISHAYYHEKNYRTALYCPIQEEIYFKSLNDIIKDVGFGKLGLRDEYLFFINEFMQFKECKNIDTYNPDKETLKFESIELKTIHIPGHSPGQSAFVVNSNPKILYISDIGSHPYYGDLISDLSKYRDSIDYLENIYLADNYILVPSHGNIYTEKDDGFFERIRKRINKNQERILNSLSKTKSKSIKELVLERILTPKERIHPTLKKLYLLWDGGMIYHHLIEFINNKMVKKVETTDFLNDKYILI